MCVVCACVRDTRMSIATYSMQVYMILTYNRYAPIHLSIYEYEYFVIVFVCVCVCVCVVSVFVCLSLHLFSYMSTVNLESSNSLEVVSRRIVVVVIVVIVVGCR